MVETAQSGLPRRGAVAVEALSGPFGAALTVDVEEWYHNCFMPEYLEPARRPAGLAQELDRLLPATAELLDAIGARATFFVLGELVGRLTGRLRELAAAGHEIGSHGFLHLRVGELDRGAFAADLRRAKGTLEDALGVEVRGYRAPEWSLRSIDNPLLAEVAAAGYRYDSSLAPCVGVGSRANPTGVSRLVLAEGSTLLEVPPLQLVRTLRLPASGWMGRLAPAAVAGAVVRHRRRGGLPLLNVHPWELVDRPLPGVLRGFGRWAHEVGRRGFRDKLGPMLSRAAPRWTPIRDALAVSRDARISEGGGATPPAVGRRAAP